LPCEHSLRAIKRHCRLLWIVRDASLAEDLLSDVFLEVWQKTSSFEARSSVSTWLMAIARYKALSARRRRIDAPLDDKTVSTIADPPDNPEIVLLKKNRGELLRQSLAGLSPEHGEVIDPVYYHEKSVKEVAEIVIAEATVKTHMFYAAQETGGPGQSSIAKTVRSRTTGAR
jgi:RNA polymerase sigma-70 factor, ECF subfamily